MDDTLNAAGQSRRFQFVGYFDEGKLLGVEIFRIPRAQLQTMVECKGLNLSVPDYRDRCFTGIQASDEGGGFRYVIEVVDKNNRIQESFQHDQDFHSDRKSLDISAHLPLTRCLWSG